MIRNVSGMLSLGLVLLSASVPIAARGQSADSLPELDDLRTPTSPAFVILGIEPTTIERPSTPRAVALGLASATREATVIPTNYALEVAPYWLVDHESLTFEDYFEPRGLDAFLQTLSFSFATSRQPVEAGDSSTAVAWGVRFLTTRGKPSERARRLNAALDEALAVSSRQIMPLEETGDSLAEARDSLRAASEQEGVNEAQRARLEAIRDRLRARIERLEVRLDSLSVEREAARRAVALVADSLDMNDRVGLVGEMAGGVSALFPGDRFEAGQLYRFGGWATLGYRGDSVPLEGLALLRFQRHTGDAEQNLMDIGGRMILSIGELALSAELVHRAVLDLEFDEGGESGTFRYQSGNRATMLMEYRLENDAYVYAGFGRDFEEVVDNDTHPLLATIGLQVHMGTKPVLKR